MRNWGAASCVQVHEFWKIREARNYSHAHAHIDACVCVKTGEYIDKMVEKSIIYKEYLLEDETAVFQLLLRTQS